MIVLRATSPAQADLEVNVTHIGFPTLTGHVARNGAWAPIIVDIALVQQAGFDGRVTASQFDGDGDEYFDSVAVHLRTESGGNARIFLFLPASPSRSRDNIHIEVRDEQGEVVPVLSQGVRTTRAELPQHVEFISDDLASVLVISSGTSGLERKITEKFSRPLRLAHLGPADVPTLWVGLEAVDYIVWDEADAGALSPQQWESLATWTRHGGTLLIAASRTADGLRLTKSIDAVLPIDIGEVSSVSNLAAMREAMVSRPAAEGQRDETADRWLDAKFPNPVPIVGGKRRPGAESVWFESSLKGDLIASRREGRGFVVFSGITLRDLFSAPGGAGLFFQKTLRLIPDQSDENSARGTPNTLPLVREVSSAVAFTTSGSIYLLTSALFAIGYAALATFGVWSFLGVKRLRQHSWTAFGILAVLASIFSVSVVGSVRGLGDRLHQVAIVDAVGGSGEGVGTVYFGMKSGIDKRVDAWLPDDWVAAREPGATACYLKPLAFDNQNFESKSFADPVQYHVSPSTGVVNDARLRATLKQFEGRWMGPLGGQVSGEIFINKGEIAEGSFLQNGLKVDLQECVLLRAALKSGEYANHRDGAIYVYDVGELKAGAARVDIAPLLDLPLRGEVEDAATTPRLGDRKIKQMPLKQAQEEWGSPFRGMLSDFAYGRTDKVTSGNERSALLLLSTIDECNPDSMKAGFSGMKEVWSRDRARQLDITDHIQPSLPASELGDDEEIGSATLIGFAKGGGPIRLFTRMGDRDFQVLEPEADYSWTMYRITIPVRSLDKPAKKETADGN